MLVFIRALYDAYEKSDSSLFEINPVLKTSDNKILAVDAKVTLMIMHYLDIKII